MQSFGEVRSISRMPNGDLQIDFRDSDVADTVCIFSCRSMILALIVLLQVCRVRAKVFIAGVGSVHMSWVSGAKR